MKRAFVIGLGCILFAGCGPVTAVDGEPGSPSLQSEDEESDLAEPIDAEEPSPTPLEDDGGFDVDGPQTSSKPCPACLGRWNPSEKTLDYSIPEGDSPSLVTMHLVLRDGGSSSPVVCSFMGKPGKHSVILDCDRNGSASAGQLVFSSGEGSMSVSVTVASTRPMEPPTIGLEEPPTIGLE